MTLSADDRVLLEGAIAKGRSLLEADFATAAEGRFGLHESGRIEEEAALALPAAERASRAELVGVVEHLRASGVSVREAVSRLLREAAFTTLNRLVAIRVAEAIDLLPESLGQGRSSRGYRELLEIFPLVARTSTGGYWTYLRLCADELAKDAPVLFDPRNPLLALEPSTKALDELVAIFADPKFASVWGDAEAFGWTYQYFNSADERQKMRQASAPRDSRELAVRNQFFTPRYVVDFLVHNTLGRRLVETDPESPLAEELGMLVDHPERSDSPLDLEEVRVLDPAVGSGHFLLGCYDVLERAWKERGVASEQAASRILPCLWGIDIDPRCAQVAAAALILRARRHCRHSDLPRPNIYTARPLPADPDAWEKALAGLNHGARRLVERIRDVLAGAPTLGSLLKVEDALRREIERYAPAAGSGEGMLFGGELASDAFREAEAQISTALRRVAEEASSTPAERLLAAEATDALGFVKAARQRYDAVLMNPPFGEPVPETKDYLKTAYPWIPWKDYNLLAAFVGRGLELLNEHGYLGAITSRAGMFLISFERWRREVLLPRRLVAFADLGLGVMEGALVEAAAYVIGADPRQPGQQAVFFRLLKETERAEALADAIAQLRDGRETALVYRLDPAELEELPGAPLAYWMPPQIRRLFHELPRLEANGAEVRQGLVTGDDFRFVRAFWEVSASAISRTREETFREKRWVPFAKGGEYSPFYADMHLVVDWENDGERIRRTGRKARVQNTSYFFRPGLTWSVRTTSGFGVRVLPRGCIFSHMGNAAFPRGSARLLLACLTSRVVRVAMNFMVAAGEETTSGTAAKHFDVGLVQRLPWLGSRVGVGEATRLEKVAAHVTLARARLDEDDETTRRFVVPRILRVAGPTLLRRTQLAWSEGERIICQALDEVLEAEGAIHSSLRLDESTENYVNSEYGLNPASYRNDAPEDKAKFERLYRTAMDDLIDEAVALQGGSRTITTKSYLVDRHLEVLAHVFRLHPRALAETRARLGLLPSDEPSRSVEDLVSWLVGCAFGRFDVRLGRDPSRARPQPDPFDPVPVSSPGMLTGDDGLPLEEAPVGYPLELRSDRILLDEQGHPWDILLRVSRAAEATFGDPDTVLEELEKVLAADLRRYLRKEFFKVHLGRYSKSRRKAPIYWHLAVPSRDWGIWLYAPALTRETLFAVVRETRRKENVLADSVARLRREQARASGRERGQMAKRLEADERLLNEVGTFRAEAERVAALGWEPDLDDGIILCAAPIATLFPAWPEAATAREEVKQRKYPWATVSRWAERL